MALKTRRDHFGVGTNINTKHFYDASRTLEDITVEKGQRNKAVVGRNAFAHEAGIHQHGMLSNRKTYEIMEPADLGAPISSLVLGKHSGKHALYARLEELGHEVPVDQREDLFAAFKVLADEFHEVSDDQLRTLVAGASNRLVTA